MMRSTYPMRTFLFLYFLSCSYLKGLFCYKSKIVKAVYSSRYCSSNRAYLNMVYANPSKDLKFDLGRIAFSLLPLSPETVGRRKTILTEVVKDELWTLDQLQGIINVNVPVRSTIIKLQSGGLFVNNPVAPTKECIRMVRSLESIHGEVKYITLSSLALEHKGTVGAFSSYFPRSAVYVQPGQYSFPVNLPIQFFFPFGKTVKDIPASSSDAPWGAEIDHEVLGVLKPKGIGGFAETAFYHRKTQTLLVTDTIVKVESEPPAIIQEDPRALLYHARDNMLQVVSDTPTNRATGWRRMVLFGLYFQPSGIQTKSISEALKMLKDVTPEMKKLGEGAIPYDGGLYPWEWVKDDKPSFEALKGKGGRGLLVSPILQKLILNRDSDIVIDWVNKICRWKFKRIIPCHLANDIQATPQDVRDAFDFLFEKPKSPFDLLSQFFPSQKKAASPSEQAFLDDISFLGLVSKQLTEQNVIFEESPLLKRS